MQETQSTADLRPIAQAAAEFTKPSTVPISEAREQAFTLDEMWAVMEDVATRSLSPISGRDVPTDADIGWAAGLMDGEGCVHIARQTYPGTGECKSFSLRIQVAQCSLAVLREFEWAVGLRGRISSPKPKRLQTRVCHYLNYSGMRAFFVLERLREHLRRKREHADLAQKFRVDCLIHVHPGCRGTSPEVWRLRHWYYERMQELNRGS
ncbi:hypothetical protein ACPWT1_02820 [Ramlibacter sp. MMS24-I3-19]|uniref:hypothetical protein n=1 Tax=Ramlibacter sp. MMS24-I3-19 TaxID=3416606 RepID=UPI003D036C6C